VTKTFRYRDRTYEYFEHPYNKAGQNSRAIEIPIAMAYLEGAPQRVLEVGNVLKHYCPDLGHNVVDYQEKGCLNVDVMRWRPRVPYDLVLSVSTVEHIGYKEFESMGDYTPREVVTHLMSFLNPGGTLFMSVPLGFNPAIDQALAEDALGPAWFMCQGKANTWHACEKEEALACEYQHWSTATAFIERSRRPFTRLNVGCGRRVLKNAINHDRTLHHDYVDIAHDLNILPWPWEDEQFAHINARAVFEHLDIDLLTALNECWRILKPGGELYIKLPFWNSSRSWDDPTHRRPYTFRTFNYFDPDTREGREYAFYTDRKWRIVRGPKLNRPRSSIICTLQKRGNHDHR